MRGMRPQSGQYLHRWGGVITIVARTFKSVKTNGSGKSFNRAKFGKPQCTHCGVLGHVIDKCYKLHGYPSSYKFKNKGS